MISKVIRKYLTSQEFEVDGFVYQFIEVNITDSPLTVNVVVNVKLPNPKQSWIFDKFSDDVENIISNLAQYLSIKLSASIQILVNGKDAKNFKYAFISREKRKEILEALNSKIKKVTFRRRGGGGGIIPESKLEFDAHFVQYEDRNYEMNDTTLDFYFGVEVSNFILNGNPVKANISTLDILSGYLTEKLHDDDIVRTNVEDIIYELLEPEVQIRNSDVYYGVLFHCGKIDGMDAEPKGYTPTFKEEFFTPL